MDTETKGTQTFSVAGPDGKAVELDTDTLVSMLRSTGRVTAITVSVKESRPRAQYQTHERFLSASVDFKAAWDLVDTVHDPVEAAAARKLLSDAVLQKILSVEQALYDTICVIQRKDSITPYERR